MNFSQNCLRIEKEIGNFALEENQKERMYEILKSINDSLQKVSENLKDFTGFSAPDASMLGKGKNLNLANKRFSFLNPSIKHFEPNSPSNQIKIPTQEVDSSEEDDTKRKRKRKKDGKGIT